MLAKIRKSTCNTDRYQSDANQSFNTGGKSLKFLSQNGLKWILRYCIIECVAHVRTILENEVRNPQNCLAKDNVNYTNLSTDRSNK